MHRRAAGALLLAGLAALPAACNALLGNEDAVPADAAADMTGSRPDAGSRDRAADGLLHDASDGRATDAAPDAPDQGPVDGGLGACDGADVMNDPKNCGSCNHSCGDATCSAAFCTPFVIADVASIPPQFITDDDAGNVYWTQGDQVLTCPTTGCTKGIPTVISSIADASPGPIACGTASYGGGVGPPTLFYSDGYAIIAMPLDGGSPQTVRGIAALVIATSGSAFAFCAGGASPGGIYGCPNTVSCGSGQLNATKCNGIATDGVELFWTSTAAVSFASFGSAGSPRSTFVTGNPQSIVTSNGHAYYNVPGAGILWLDVDGGGGAFLSDETTFPNRLATDGRSLFWVDSDGVDYCPLDGGCPEAGPLHLAKSTSAFAVTTDALGVYFTDDQTNQVKALARP